MFRFSWLAYLNNLILSQLYKIIRRNYNTWRFIARHYNGILDYVAYFNACLICDWGTYKVPAYRHYYQEKNAQINFWHFKLEEYPETNKNDYCKKYDFFLTG